MKSPEMGNGSPEKEPRMPDDILKTILLLEYSGIPNSTIIQDLENPPSGKQGYSKKEIDRAFQKLRDCGFVDERGLISDEGIDFIKNADI